MVCGELLVGHVETHLGNIVVEVGAGVLQKFVTNVSAQVGALLGFEIEALWRKSAGAAADLDDVLGLVDGHHVKQGVVKDRHRGIEGLVGWGEIVPNFLQVHRLLLFVHAGDSLKEILYQ